MQEELQRFLTLFDILVNKTNAWMACVPANLHEWMPSEGRNVQLGDRVESVTIKSLFLHIAVSDHHMVRNLASCPPGGTISIPHDPEMTERLANGDFVSETLAMHRRNMEIVQGYSDETLRKALNYADTKRTVADYLWSQYAHRAHHFGHIDLYMRQANCEPPPYYPF